MAGSQLGDSMRGEKVSCECSGTEQEYDDGYGTAYDEQTYDSYDNSYSTQAQSGADYYDYGHGLSEETYESYAIDYLSKLPFKVEGSLNVDFIYSDMLERPGDACVLDDSQEEWTNSRHKAPPARTTKGVYRDQPYARY
ncbi:KH domain containing, RNA binding, signal transduction associated 3 [Amazona aestiva]|uniref:KH domain containing, RNA binding, signal transduction associated 3 n=1 Tax=Amazona aestiva TaxID=12930 RepID=A0A0Q3LUV9_AMAAE|nr:KH domain containing, RNA binding, signal transduction associated 3 [Amazona aestiva]